MQIHIHIYSKQPSSSGITNEHMSHIQILYKLVAIVELYWNSNYIMWSHVMWCDLIRCDTMYDMMWCVIIWYDRIEYWYWYRYWHWYDIIWYYMIWHGMAIYHTIKYHIVSYYSLFKLIDDKVNRLQCNIHNMHIYHICEYNWIQIRSIIFIVLVETVYLTLWSSMITSQTHISTDVLGHKDFPGRWVVCIEYLTK